MVIAHHLIFTAYGFWLPNDPRGSWSDFVRNWELYWYGGASKVTTRLSLAQDTHDRTLRHVQKTALRYDPVRFTDAQIHCVARGFARAVNESGYQFLACSIMPEHVHIVVRRHRNPGERIIGHLKTRATQQLIDELLHPFLNQWPRLAGLHQGDVSICVDGEPIRVHPMRRRVIGRVHDSPPQNSTPSPSSAARRPAYVGSLSGRRALVYEHHATVRSHAIEQNRSLRPHAARHVIDWNGSLPATEATRPRIGR